MNNVPLLEVKDLWKSFQTKKERIDVLRGINLRIYPGDSIAIIGASGMGKSTFLHILGTLERPTRGQVLYKGKDVSQLLPDALARFRNQKIGFIFQFHYLLPEFNALENVMLPALIAGWTYEKARTKAMTLLEKVDLGNRFNHRVGELSGGEQQRVAIARALILEPEVVLADEPTGNLDETTAQNVQQLLFSLQKKTGITMLVATHNLKLASSFPICYELSAGQLKRVMGNA
ncbi:MAG: ABC transporter ATP-binding protein [Candidatus Desulfofervidaceae bacterium]|nr:ABC transporter ATP-binding protein [Candidatus Desulfofervidaceae bacterium]